MSDTVKIYDELIQRLLENENVYICGPDGSYPEHLRVYAHGGRLCLLPIDKSSFPQNLELPKDTYIKHLYPDVRHRLEEEEIITKSSNKTAAQIEEGKRYIWCRDKNRWSEHFIKEMDTYLEMAKNRFSANAERSVQTVICSNHRDFSKHNCVVFDFEHCIDGDLFYRMSKESDTSLEAPKTPNFDMVSFEIIDGSPRATIIELKCTKDACEDSESGLTVHARDMSIACRYSNCPKNNEHKIHLLNRLKMMLEYNLLSNVPVDIDALLANPAPLTVRSGFLFVPKEGLCIKKKRKDQKTVTELCQELIPKDLLDNFYYQFSESAEDVDLSKMLSWDEFSKKSE